MPLNPKLLTAAVRRPSGPGSHAVGSLTTKKGLPSKSIAGFGARQCRDGGSSRWRSARSAFISPATPAAIVVCPMFPFTDPMPQ